MIFYILFFQQEEQEKEQVLVRELELEQGVVEEQGLGMELEQGLVWELVRELV